MDRRRFLRQTVQIGAAVTLPAGLSWAAGAEDGVTAQTISLGSSLPLSGPMGVAGKDITAEEWQQLDDRDVTPRFRDGLTVFDAHGQWLGQNGQVVREQSKALMVIHGHDAQSEAGIEALRQGYKSRFAQESVMRVDQPVCVQF